MNIRYLILCGLLHMTCPATSLAIHPPLPPTAQEAARSLVVAPANLPQRWHGGVPVPMDAPNAGGQTIRWRHADSLVLAVRPVPRDWTGIWNTLDFWIHSHHPAPTRCTLIIPSDNPQTRGSDYYSLSIDLNFTGWKHVAIPLNSLTVSQSPQGWNQIDGIRFHAHGWGNVPDPSAVLTLSSIRLVYQKPIQGPLLTDRQLFQALDLDTPGMEKVRQAADRQDFVFAKKELAAYYRQRTTVSFPIDPRKLGDPASRNPQYPTQAADRIRHNVLTSCSVPHDFGEQIDWSLNPTRLKYAEWTWQLSRHSFWSELGRAYWATGKEAYAQAFARQLRSWIIQNPRPRQVNNGVGSRWRTIEAGIRMFSSWPEAYHRFLLSPSFDDDTLIMMLKSICEHARYLRQFPTRNNWLTHEMNGLYHAGALFPEFKEAGDWRDTAAGRLYDEMNIQVYPDGAQRELTIGYHGISLRHFLGIHNIARLNRLPLPPDYVPRLERMFQVYLNVTSPDGFFPPFNDSGWGDARTWLKKGAALFPNRTDFLHAATGGRQGTPPEQTSCFMPYAGWATMRSGWQPQDLYACFEVGPFGAAHQHEDKLSFVLRAYGSVLVTEGGNYPYDASQWRTYVLSPRAHNLLRVDGFDQSRRGRPQFCLQKTPLRNTWISNAGFDVANGTYHEGFGPQGRLKVRHSRTLVFLKATQPELTPYWLVIDVMTPPDRHPHAYDTWFHFNTPNARIVPQINAAATEEPGKPNLLIASLNHKPQSLSLVTGQQHPEVQGWMPRGAYGVRPVATPTFSRQTTGQACNVYALIPAPAGKALPMPTVQGQGNTFLITFENGAQDTIRIQPDMAGKLKVLAIQRKSGDRTIVTSLHETI